MSVKITYTCDKCGSEQYTPDQFWNVSVHANVLRSGTLSCPVVGKKMQVCRPCLEALGIYAQPKAWGEPVPEPPTLEDLIREIVAGAIETY